MPGDRLKSAMETTLSKALGKSLTVEQVAPVGGGSINRAGVMHTKVGRFFVKWNDAHAYPRMFELEKQGLDLLRGANAVYVPKTYATGSDGQEAFLIMELVEPGRRVGNFYEDFGERLATLHLEKASQHGLGHDNYIGSLPQQNNRHDKWVDFFIAERLEPMVSMARNQGLINEAVVRQFENMYTRLEAILPEEPASLMHGDLWGGNHMTGPEGTVCLFDPAAYYGNREMEIAFTQVFSGYPAVFYNAYESHWPLQPGFEKRKGIYQLWPLMVHVNLFGTSYLSPVKRILQVF
jgi:fructosamine-3-kinase